MIFVNLGDFRDKYKCSGCQNLSSQEKNLIRKRSSPLFNCFNGKETRKQLVNNKHTEIHPSKIKLKKGKQTTSNKDNVVTKEEDEERKKTSGIDVDSKEEEKLRDVLQEREGTSLNYSKVFLTLLNNFLGLSQSILLYISSPQSILDSFC